MKIEVATQTEILEAQRLAKAWATGLPIDTLNTIAVRPSLAVAEFCLNQKGKTMYQNMVSE